MPPKSASGCAVVRVRAFETEWYALQSVQSKQFDAFNSNVVALAPGEPPMPSHVAQRFADEQGHELLLYHESVNLDYDKQFARYEQRRDDYLLRVEAGELKDGEKVPIKPKATFRKFGSYRSHQEFDRRRRKMQWRPEVRCFYEYIRPNRPSRVYLDAEWLIQLNTLGSVSVDDDIHLRMSLVGNTLLWEVDLVLGSDRALPERDGGHLLALKGSRDKPGHGYKASAHFLVPPVYSESQHTATWLLVHGLVLPKLKDDPLAFWTRTKQHTEDGKCVTTLQRESIIDGGVYKRDGCSLRTIGSSKADDSTHTQLQFLSQNDWDWEDAYITEPYDKAAERNGGREYLRLITTDQVAQAIRGLGWSVPELPYAEKGRKETQSDADAKSGSEHTRTTSPTVGASSSCFVRRGATI